MEVEKAASRGVANTALGLSIGALGWNLLGGGLGGVLNGGGNACAAGYSRYDAEKDARIAELETEVKLRDANTFTMGEMGKLRDYVDNRFTRVEHEICEQKVYNATNTSALGCLANQVNGLQAVLNKITKTVVGNDVICPGWGDVTVSIAPATTTTTTT